MKRLALRTLGLAAVSAGAVLALSAPAQADTGFNSGWYNGNQFSRVTQVPVNFCGNAVSVLGFASASCQGGAYAYNGGGWGDDDWYDNAYYRPTSYFHTRSFHRHHRHHRFNSAGWHRWHHG